MGEASAAHSPGFGLAVGAGGIAVGLKKTVEAASNLNEEIAKSQQIFGSSADEIEAWSETSAESMKVSQTEALKATGNFGAMFRTIGLGTQQTAGMSKRLAQLGADMASFNNEDPTAMLDRLRSGFAGEAEPLRRFGVLISEARVKTEAYRSGIARVGSKLTEQQKVQARYNLILRDTKLQQGDVARTGDQWAGQLRELRARIEDTAAELGQELLPAITDVVDEVQRMAGEAREPRADQEAGRGDRREGRQAWPGDRDGHGAVGQVLGQRGTAGTPHRQARPWLQKAWCQPSLRPHHRRPDRTLGRTDRA